MSLRKTRIQIFIGTRPECIKLAHVEAGLRSGNRYSPWPEEINRAVIGRLARCHLAPTEKNVQALRRECVDGEIHVVGLVGTKEDGICEGINQLLNDENAYDEMAKSENPFGRGVSSRHHCRCSLATTLTDSSPDYS